MTTATPDTRQGDLLIRYLSELKEKQAVNQARLMLDQGIAPLFIIQSCQQGLIKVGELFEQHVYFLSGLMMAGEILKTITTIISPFLTTEAEHAYFGRVLIGTTQGDLHEIGKNLAVILLKGHGFDVLDLGVDVAPSEFVLKAREFRPDIVALSVLLSSAYDTAWETFHIVESKSGLKRSSYKTLVGGGLMNQMTCDYIGADAWARDVMSGVRYCLSVVGRAKQPHRNK